MVLSDCKVPGTILVNADGITLRIDDGTDLESLDGSFEGSSDGNIEVLLIWVSLGTTCGKVLVYDKSIKLRLYYGIVIGSQIGNV